VHEWCRLHEFLCSAVYVCVHACVCLCVLMSGRFLNSPSHSSKNELVTRAGHKYVCVRAHVCLCVYVFVYLCLCVYYCVCIIYESFNTPIKAEQYKEITKEEINK